MLAPITFRVTCVELGLMLVSFCVGDEFCKPLSCHGKTNVSLRYNDSPKELERLEEKPVPPLSCLMHIF